jgi:hypothetical protein
LGSAFQTRIQWDEMADLALIQHPMECLRQFTEETTVCASG